MGLILRSIAWFWLVAGVASAALIELSVIGGRQLEIIGMTRVLAEPWNAMFNLAGFGQNYAVVTYLVGVLLNGWILLSFGNQARARR
ncbi:MAG: hypothetical protein ACRC1J_07070 [Sandaracinobacteroides sp.]